MKRTDFYLGQKLVTPQRHKDNWDCADFVVVVYVSETKDIVHYELTVNDDFRGSLQSGMPFNEAEEYVTQPTKK